MAADAAPAPEQRSWDPTVAALNQQAWDLADGPPLLITDGATSYIYGPNNQPIEQVSTLGTLYYYADQLGSTVRWPTAPAPWSRPTATTHQVG